jgi:simple sugar transport system permease protein
MDDIIISVLQRSLVFATPLYLATLGAIVTERSGVLNLGMEGLIAFGAYAGFAATASTGSAWLGILAALAAGALLAGLHALVSVTFRASQVVSGLALTMIGTGAAGMWGKPFVGKAAAQRLGAVDFGFLSELPVVGRVLFSQDPFFYLSLCIGIVLWFFLAHTRPGLRLRSVGENPKAADALGVRTSLVRWLSVMGGGALASMAGAQLSLSYSASWTESMSGGRGWIVIALTIFALWNPLRAFWGSLLFGGIFVLQYLLQPLGIPPSILGMLPYIATLTVLVADGLHKDSRSLFAPAMLGEAYKRGER